MEKSSDQIWPRRRASIFRYCERKVLRVGLPVLHGTLALRIASPLKAYIYSACCHLFPMHSRNSDLPSLPLTKLFLYANRKDIQTYPNASLYQLIKPAIWPASQTSHRRPASSVTTADGSSPTRLHQPEWLQYEQGSAANITAAGAQFPPRSTTHVTFAPFTQRRLVVVENPPLPHTTSTRIRHHPGRVDGSSSRSSDLGQHERERHVPQRTRVITQASQHTRSRSPVVHQPLSSAPSGSRQQRFTPTDYLFKHHIRYKQPISSSHHRSSIDIKLRLNLLQPIVRPQNTHRHTHPGENDTAQDNDRPVGTPTGLVCRSLSRNDAGFQFI